MNIRGLCKAWLAIGQLAFLRVVARLRTDSNHERTLVPPRECELPFAVNTTVGVLGLVTALVLLSLILFCSSRASMLLIRLRIIFLLVSSKYRRRLTVLTRNIKRSFVRILQLVNIFAKSHATLRAHRSWLKVSSCDLSSRFDAQKLRL